MGFKVWGLEWSYSMCTGIGSCWCWGASKREGERKGEGTGDQAGRGSWKAVGDGEEGEKGAGEGAQ